MSATISYKGSTLTTVINSTATLTTEGKYLEADILVTDTSPLPFEGRTSVVPSETQYVFHTSGKVMEDDITVFPIPESYGRLEWDGTTLRVY